MNSPSERVERSGTYYSRPAPDEGYVEGFATNLYHDRNFDSPAAKILPGEYFVTEKEMVLVTVLGSCVAACIRDTESGIGGMNHFMLPDEGGKDVVSNSARYGTYAMEVLINHLLKSGARRNRLEAKVFGGGAVLESLTVEQRWYAQCRVCSEFSADRENSRGGQGSARFVSAQGLLLSEQWAGAWCASCTGFTTTPCSAAKRNTVPAFPVPRLRAISNSLPDLWR